MTPSRDEKQNPLPVVTLAENTVFRGVLHFKETLSIRGKFYGTIEADGNLIVEKGAIVEADHIYVDSLSVQGTVKAQVRATDKVDLMTGAHMHGDIEASRLRIADGVLFEGQCIMTDNEKDIEIFSCTTDEIKAQLLLSDA